MGRPLTCLLLLLLPPPGVPAEERAAPTPEQAAFFEAKIRPVLVGHCYKCHAAGAKVIRGGLRVDSRDGLLKGGDSGAALVPGRAEKSLLLKALRHDGIAMPPTGKLPESVVKDFETWITMGAPDPRRAGEVPAAGAAGAEPGRQHWAFRPVTDPKPPPVKDDAWPLDSLDRFLLARLEQAGLRPAADADRYTWLRRVSLDLTGLPPTPAEVDAFVRDNSPRACETVVERLLGSRAFGERWARHWLDLTGYADMMGTSNSVYAEHAWRYRDYLIAAFNRDKPFDRFVREQVAGDLLPAASPPERAENLTATGFLMVGDVEIVEPDKAKLEADHIDTQVAKIGTAFLGMTLGCARCHDHKFDPVGLSDYYGIAGMFRSSPSTHKSAYGVWSSLNTTDLPETPDQRAARQKREAEQEKKIAGLKAERSRLEAERKSVAEELARLDRARPDKAEAGAGPGAAAPSGPGAKESLVKKRDALAERLKKLDQLVRHAEFFRSEEPKAFALRDGDRPADMPVYVRGNPYAPGAAVPRGAIRAASWDSFPAIPAGQSGRAQLADWLVDRRNPLTARVTVNRVWQKLFGEGLVRSVDYFGTRGEAPSHPELLDHLATRFMRHGWSQKQLIRALVLSRAYRLGSANDPAALKADPDNRLLWRMNRQRLDAEALRDALLAVSGELRPSGGGPALVLEEPDNCGELALKGINPPSYAHRKPRASQEFQRTVYLPVMRTNFAAHDRLRTFFDFVNPAQIAGQRNQTVVPTQALFAMNNDLFRKRAGALADRLIAETPHPEARVSQLWLTAYNRPVTGAERGAVRDFLQQLEPALDAGGAAARESLLWQELCHSLLASNEFLFRF